MPTLPEHLGPPQIFSGVRVARSLVFCVLFCGMGGGGAMVFNVNPPPPPSKQYTYIPYCFVDRCLSSCPFSIGNCLYRVFFCDLRPLIASFGIFNLFVYLHLKEVDKYSVLPFSRMLICFHIVRISTGNFDSCLDVNLKDDINEKTIVVCHALYEQ